MINIIAPDSGARMIRSSSFTSKLILKSGLGEDMWSVGVIIFSVSLERLILER
jgi:hypothetical protein